MIFQRDLSEGLKSYPFRVKTMIINNFPGPAYGVVVEIYQVYSLHISDGHTRKTAQQRPCLRRSGRRGSATWQHDDDESVESGVDRASKSKKSRRRRHANSSTDYSSDASEESSYEKKKKGIMHATKSLWSSKSNCKDVGERNCHLLGPYGFNKSPPPVGLHFR